MLKIGITGSLASGKTTASKILSHRRGPLFSADKIVNNLYKKNNFIKLLMKNFCILKKTQLKNILKNKVLESKKNLTKLEKLIQHMVRRKMKEFTTLHKRKNKIFYEIPLLLESKLTKYFDVIIFIKAK